MSCGCGGLPPSITLRLRALELAVQGGSNVQYSWQQSARETIDKAQKLLDFIAPPEELKALDEAAAKKGSQSQDGASRYRNAMLGFVVEAIFPQDPSVVSKLGKAGVNTIGALAQWFPHQLVEHAKMMPSEVESVSAALRTRGLSLGMNSDSLRDWILFGRSSDGQTTVQVNSP